MRVKRYRPKPFVKTKKYVRYISLLLAVILQSAIVFASSIVIQNDDIKLNANRKTATMDNLSPTVDFELVKKRSVDINFCIGDTSTYDNTIIQNKFNSIIKPKLDSEGVEYTLSVFSSTFNVRNTVSKAAGVNVNGDGYYIDSNGNSTLALSGVISGAGYFDSRTLFVKNDGTVWTKGVNGNGELGYGYTSTQTTEYFAKVPSLGGIISVASGSYHSVALSKTGNVYIWGDNNNYQCGTGNKNTRNFPTPITVTQLSNIESVYAGSTYSIALSKNGTAYIWGTLNYGAGIYANPTAILTDVKQVAAGTEYALFLKKDGTLWGIGRNDYGVLGNGSASFSGTVVKSTYSAFTNIKSISAGINCSMLVKNDGTLWFWGAASGRYYGYAYAPQQIAGITDASKVFSGQSYVQKKDGSLWVYESGNLIKFNWFIPMNDMSESVYDSLKNQTYKAGSESYYIHISDSAIPELNTSNVVSSILSIFMNRNTTFIGLGSSSNQSQFSSLASQNNGYGTYIPNSNIDNAFNQLAGYISRKVSANINVNLGNTAYDMNTVKSKINTVLKPKLASNGIAANITVTNPQTTENRFIYYIGNSFYAYDHTTNINTKLGTVVAGNITDAAIGPNGKIYYLCDDWRDEYKLAVNEFDIKTGTSRIFCSSPNGTNGAGQPILTQPRNITVDAKNRIYCNAYNPSWSNYSVSRYEPKTGTWTALFFNDTRYLVTNGGGSAVAGITSILQDGTSWAVTIVNGSIDNTKYPVAITGNRNGNFYYFTKYVGTIVRERSPTGLTSTLNDGYLSTNNINVTNIVSGDSNKLIYGASGSGGWFSPNEQHKGLHELDLSTNATRTILTESCTPITYTTGRILYYTASDGTLWYYDFNSNQKGQTSVTSYNAIKYPPYDVYSGTSKPLDSAINEVTFKTDSSNYYVQIDDKSMPELDNSARLAAVTNTLNKNNAKFIGLGKTANQTQINSIINNINGKGDFYDNSNLDTALNSVGDFIIDNAMPKLRSINGYMSVYDTLDTTNKSYNDIENDAYDEDWYFEHDPKNFIKSDGTKIAISNTAGTNSNDRQHLSAMISSFIETDPWGNKNKKVGSYKVYHKDIDKPKGSDTRFDNFRRDSNVATRTVNVITPPQARYTITAAGTQSEFSIKLEDNNLSFAPEHMNRSDKGIVMRKWGITKVDANTTNNLWEYTYTTAKSITYSVSGNSNYIVSLEVQDCNSDDGYGFWSEPLTQVIETDGKPVAQFDITPNPMSTTDTATVRDTSYTTSIGATITDRYWTITKDGSSTFSYVNQSSCKTNYSDSGQGSYNITLVVKDSNGKMSDPYTQVLVVSDNVPPDITANPTQRAWSNTDVNVTLTATDSGGSGLKHIIHTYTKDLNNIPATTTVSISSSPLKNTYSTVATQSVEGIWYLVGRAVDYGGSASNFGNYKSWGPYRIDKTPPLIDSNPSASNVFDDSVTFNVYSSDALSGVNNIKVLWSLSATPPAFTDTSWTQVLNSTMQTVLPNNGNQYYLHMLAYDYAGNIHYNRRGPFSVMTYPTVTAADLKMAYHKYGAGGNAIPIVKELGIPARSDYYTGYNTSNLYGFISAGRTLAVRVIARGTVTGAKFDFIHPNYTEPDGTVKNYERSIKRLDRDTRWFEWYKEMSRTPAEPSPFCRNNMWEAFRKMFEQYGLITANNTDPSYSQVDSITDLDDNHNSYFNSSAWPLDAKKCTYEFTMNEMTQRESNGTVYSNNYGASYTNLDIRTAVNDPTGQTKIITFYYPLPYLTNQTLKTWHWMYMREIDTWKDTVSEDNDPNILTRITTPYRIDVTLYNGTQTGATSKSTMYFDVLEAYHNIDAGFSKRLYDMMSNYNTIRDTNISDWECYSNR